jgi:TolB protein
LRRSPAIQLTLALLAGTLGITGTAHAGTDRAELQSTKLISRALDGGLPNGESSHAVISTDRRYARAIVFESDATNLVRRDTNGVKDIFAIRRVGHIDNIGGPWQPGKTVRVSRPRRGGQANGPSWAATVGGAFRARPRCVAFLSAASNLVPHDTNGKVDAFVADLNGRGVRRISLPRNHQAGNDTTSVALAGDCSRFSFVTNGYVYTRIHGRTKKIGYGLDPSYSTGIRNDMVYAGTRGVYLVRDGLHGRRLVAPGGTNPAYNDIKRQVVTYEKRADGHTQVFWRDLGHKARPASARGLHLGNGDSHNPMISNAGYYIMFDSDATNLGVNSLSRAGDFNSRTDSYLYTNVRDITLVQSVFEKAVPLADGGVNSTMSWYANYILFDTSAPMGTMNQPHQIYMRYLGPL